MTAPDTPRVRFDADEIALTCAGWPGPMTIAWADIASVEAGRFAWPEGDVRLLTLVHTCGVRFEVPYAASGFPELLAELVHRFEFNTATRENFLSVVAPAGVCIRVSERKA